MSEDVAGAFPLPSFQSLVSRAPPLRGTSLSRLSEVQQYIRQCDDPKSFKMYHKVGFG